MEDDCSCCNKVDCPVRCESYSCRLKYFMDVITLEKNEINFLEAMYNKYQKMVKNTFFDIEILDGIKELLANYKQGLVLFMNSDGKI